MRLYKRILLSSALMTLTLLGVNTTDTNAQAVDVEIRNGEVVDVDVWNGAPTRFGIYGGPNGNFVGAGEQQLEYIGTRFGQPQVDGDKDVIDGSSWGYHFGAMLEYNSGDFVGGQLRASVDDRRVKFNDWDIDGSTAERFSARMTYLSIEPMLRLNLGNPDFHFTAGPLLSFLLDAKYDYTPGRDETNPAIEGEPINDANDFVFGVSGGFGYDFMLNDDPMSSTRWYLTPYFEGSYMLDQVKADFPNKDRNDTWVTTTLRGGLQLKLGVGASTAPPPVAVDPTRPSVDLAVRAPSTIVEEREVREYFPLRNYIFFAPNQTTIPTEYHTLTTAQAASFNESSLLNAPGTGSSSNASRAQRQMSVYYNLLNVYGSRLQNNPSATIELVGAAPDVENARAMANSVREYFVNVFGIDASRISTRGVVRPPHASGDRDTPKEDLDLVAEENLRVEVLTKDEKILAPVEIRSMQSDPIDNDVVMSVRTAAAGPVESWTVRVTGNGFDRTYGPYQGSMTETRIDGKPLLGTMTSGRYTATVTARTTDGTTLTESESFNLARVDAPPTAGKRFSILFEFDNSTTVDVYEEFLRNTVAPQIPNNATVVVHGHTDKVGLEDYNMKLSDARAKRTMDVLKSALSGRNVKFDSYGFGETEMRAPFGNETPEGRYYNRTVMIEVIPNS